MGSGPGSVNSARIVPPSPAASIVSSLTPASSARFRRRRLLIVGCGDVGLRVARHLSAGWRVLALTSDPARVPALRQRGLVPLVGNLDEPASLKRLAGLAGHVLHLAPPPGRGAGDGRSRALSRALARRTPPTRLVYASTTGVYGDAGGERFDETRRVCPSTDRARRRVDAERGLRHWGRHGGPAVAILRIPGIYALDRVGGDPRERLRRGTPVLEASNDVYTNHVHADDLARACIRALLRGASQRLYHVCDDSQRTMGEHFDHVAGLSGLPRPPRISRAEAERVFSPVQLSFLSESRRLCNHRLKRELGLRLRYPDVGAAFGAD